MSQPGHTIEKYKVIEIFAMQLMHQPIEFRPKELFTINNQHIFEVCGERIACTSIIKCIHFPGDYNNHPLRHPSPAILLDISISMFEI